MCNTPGPLFGLQCSLLLSKYSVSAPHYCRKRGLSFLQWNFENNDVSTVSSMTAITHPTQHLGYWLKSITNIIGVCVGAWGHSRISEVAVIVFAIIRDGKRSHSVQQIVVDITKLCWWFRSLTPQNTFSQATFWSTMFFALIASLCVFAFLNDRNYIYTTQHLGFRDGFRSLAPPKMYFWYQ